MRVFPLIMLSSYKTLVAKELRKIASRVSALEEILPRRSSGRLRSTPEYSEVGGRYSRRALGVPT